MRYLKKIIKLFVDDKWLALGIIISLLLAKLLIVIHVSSDLTGPLFVIFLMVALWVSITREQRRKRS